MSAEKQQKVLKTIGNTEFISNMCYTGSAGKT